MPPDAETRAALSDPAKLALTSLEERPDLNTAQLISSGPFGIQQINVEEFDAGLHELEAADAVERGPFGWRLLA